MKYSESLKLMSVMSIAYPQFSEKEASKRARLWAQMFAEEPYALVDAAIRTFMSSDTKGFPPSIGQIKNICRSLTAEEKLTPAEGVALILKAIKNSAYNSVKEFEKLPETCKKVVNNPSQLKDWANMEVEETNTVLASNLRRAMDIQLRKEKEKDMIPDDVKKLIGNRMKMIGGNDD